MRRPLTGLTAYEPEKHARFLSGEVGALHFAAGGGSAPVRVDRRALGGGREARDQRMLGGNDHIGRAKQRVRSGGEHVQRFAGQVREGEDHLRALGTADPVSLHQLDRLGPVDQREVVEQAFREDRDPHHPLAQGTLEHRMIAALGTPFVGHLLVGEHRAQRRTPVHGYFGEVRQSLRIDEGSLRGGTEGAPVRTRAAGIGGCGIERSRVGIRGIASFGQCGPQCVDRPGLAFERIKV